LSVRRIHITGASGSGTTTLGRALATRLSWPHLDGDDFYWLPPVPPFANKRDPAERTRLALNALGRAEHAVWSGSIVRWGDDLEDAFDFIVFLTVPPELRLTRLERRELERYGAVDPEFLAWARRYDDGDESVRSRRLHERWLSERRCPVLRLDGDLTVEQRVTLCLQRIEAKMV
jgi:adenylate kinase family enzyme